MKNLTVIPFSFVVLALLNTSVLAQEPPAAEKREGVTYYSVILTKFKVGKADEARKIIYDYFWPTDKAIDRDVIPFDTLVGEWDHVVYFPLADGPAELAWEMSPTNEKWWKAFAERAGGLEQATEIWERFLDLVADSKSEVVMTRWSPPSSQ